MEKRRGKRNIYFESKKKRELGIDLLIEHQLELGVLSTDHREIWERQYLKK